MRFLLAEDHHPLRQSLTAGLQAEGYAIDATGDGEEAWWYLDGGSYDAVILDRMLPGIDGLSILSRMRDHRDTTPVLLLTAMDTVEDRVAGLDAGADDYLTKPFAVPELLARIRTLVRRRQGRCDPILHCDQLQLNPATKTVHWAETAIQVSQREFMLLQLLMRDQGIVVSRSQLWDHLYDFEAEATSNVLDVLVGRLRKKLTAAGAPSLIYTRRGHGYQLCGPETRA